MLNNPTEIALVAFIILVLFGTKKLPELGTGLGQAISNFKKGYREGNAIDVTPEQKQSAPSEEQK